MIHSHERWLGAHGRLQRRILTPLASIQAQEQFQQQQQHSTLVTQRRTVVEAREVPTDQRFVFLQECLDWVQRRTVKENGAENG